MGYNGNNRRLRTNVFSRRQTRQGSRIMGNLLIGALGAGVAEVVDCQKHQETEVEASIMVTDAP